MHSTHRVTHAELSHTPHQCAFASIKRRSSGTLISVPCISNTVGFCPRSEDEFPNGIYTHWWHVGFINTYSLHNIVERQKSPWCTHVLSKVRFRLWLKQSIHMKKVIGSSNMLANLSEFQRLKCGGKVPNNRHFLVKVKVIYANLRLISCHYCIANNWLKPDLSHHLAMIRLGANSCLNWSDSHF